MGAQIDISTCRQELTTLLVNFTYAVLEKRTGVNRYYLWNIVHNPDYQPPAKVCAKLGIVRLEPAPVCPTHGIVHCYDCTAERVRPLRPPAAPRARRAISLTDPESAACTILSKADGDYVDRLIELLRIRRYHE